MFNSVSVIDLLCRGSLIGFILKQCVGCLCLGCTLEPPDNSAGGKEKEVGGGVPSPKIVI